MLSNLANYKARKNEERRQKIRHLYQRIDFIYADEKIKPEKLEEYTNGLVRELKLTSQIEAFARVLAQFMPKYNELKHFNAAKIVAAYQAATVEQKRLAQLAEDAGPLNLNWTFEGTVSGATRH